MVAELMKKLKDRFKGKRQVWVMQGLPGTGKTTIIARIMSGPSAFGKVSLSLDKVREKLYGDAAIQGVLSDVLAEAERQFDELIVRYQIIMIDVTCTQRLEFDFWAKVAAKWGVTPSIVRIANYNDVELAKERNAARAWRNERFVPEDVLDMMSGRLSVFDYSGIQVTDWDD